MILKIPRIKLYLLITIIVLLQSCDNNKSNDKIEHKNDFKETKKLIEIGYQYYQKIEFDSSFYYYNKAKNNAELQKDTARIIHSLSWMAQIQRNQGDYSGSEATSVEALPLIENPNKYLYGQTNIYIGLANNYLLLYDNDNAIHYFKKAINSKTDQIIRASIEHNISIALIENGQYNTAIEILISLIKQREILNNPETFAQINNTLGTAYKKTHNKKALYFLNKGLNIRILNKDYWGMVGSYYELSDYYKETNLNLTAKYALAAYKLCVKFNFNEAQLESLKLLMLSTKGDELTKHTKKYLSLNDSILKNRQKAKNNFAKIKYDSKKEKEENISLKEQKTEDRLQIQIQKNKNQLLYILVGFILFVFAFILYYIKNKSNREKLQISYKTETQIAKKLHDELANDVYQMMKFTETKDLSTPKNKEILLKSLDTVYDRTRNISKENSNIHTDEQFTAQLKMMLLDFNTPEISLIINGLESIEWSLIEDTKKITLYRILQELLVNMKKHSQCSIVVIVLKREKKKLQLSYTDNGIGFNNKKDRHSNGLKNIKNRIESIKGTITFNSVLEKGTKINIQFPV
ncbi:signal transduction histidine kinase [Flavobacterium sp. 7E]|uniref:tetratricopeptide repeat-containing sensor histidine kinase n=1 Tax=unclassified Flavobacterium TaxID=196869 RepID=UPI0015712758|nr:MULTISPECIES: tetratricopeptide repeat-containing sensor histidine kinase [unclassified Flavobacterium]MBE0390880.1 Sensor histidine kinase LiaS [Flavobacterium sp. PL002]NRS89578.1 signal transduction histidine kinase [Flavobacterium sp. 7E]